MDYFFLILSHRSCKATQENLPSPTYPPYPGSQVLTWVTRKSIYAIAGGKYAGVYLEMMRVVVTGIKENGYSDGWLILDFAR